MLTPGQQVTVSFDWKGSDAGCLSDVFIDNVSIPVP